jgi:hypothetical protein
MKTWPASIRYVGAVADAGVGAAAALATTLLALGLVLALRSDREANGNP